MSSDGDSPDADGKPMPYDVGYGRPRKSRLPDSFPKLNEERLKQVTLQEAYRKIAIRDGDRTVELTMIEAVIRSIGLNAAKGDKRSQKCSLNRCAPSRR